MKATKTAPEKSVSAARVSWENILTSLEEGVVVTDAEGKISFFNQAAEVLTELPASHAVNLPYAEVFGRSPWLVEMIRKSEPPDFTGSRGEGELTLPREDHQHIFFRAREHFVHGVVGQQHAQILLAGD